MLQNYDITFMIDTLVTLEALNRSCANNMGEHLGIEYIDITENYLLARMPVDKRTWQPLGMLNGGASAALAETVGSTAAYLSLDRSQFYCLGLQITSNHIRTALNGYVYGKATPIHQGKKTHVWQIEIKDEAGNLINQTTLTMAILEHDERSRELVKKMPLD